MNLHKHREEFQELVTITSQQLGIEEIYIEKDYFVILALKGLSESDYRDNGIFKGGTSLSKAYGIINRFSEDIDIAILNDEGTDIGNRKRMEKVEQALTTDEVLDEDPDHERVKKRTRLRQTVYNYPLLTNVENFGQISKHIFIDVNRISPGLPFEEKNISTYIHDYLNEKRDVIAEFELEPVTVNVLCMERTFAEKFGTIVKFAVQEHGDGTQPLDRLKKGIRHIYDLHMLLQDERIQAFTQGRSKFDGMNFNEFMERVLRDDLEGMRNEEGYAEYMNSEFSGCLLYANVETTWEQLRTTYEGEFRRLLFANIEPPSSKKIIKSLNILSGLCEQFDAWKKENKVTFGE